MAHASPLGRLLSRRHLVILLGIWIAHVAMNAAWIHQDTSFRSFDGPPHLDAAAHAHGLVRANGLRGVLQVARGNRAGCWPSAGYLTWVLPSMITGTSIPTLRNLNLVFLALLLVSVYAIGRRVHSRRAGLLAAALVTLYPALYGESRQFGVDFPGTAITAAGVALLLYTERFSRLRTCLLLGLLVGLGVLLRPQICFFLAGPTVLLLASALLRPGDAGRKRVLLNVAACAAVAAAASAVWWRGRLGEILGAFVFHQEEAEKICEVYETSALFYVKMLPACFSATLLLAALAGVLGLLAGGARPARAGWLVGPRFVLVLAWLLVGFAVLSYIRVNHLRYMLPLAPALALVTAVGLMSVAGGWFRKVVIALFLAAAAASLVLDSHPATGPLPLGFPNRLVKLSNGPPRQDTLIKAADRVATQLLRRHGSGRDLEVRLAAARHTAFSRVFWLVSPVLRTRLPGIVIRFHPPIGSHEVGTDGADFHIGCTYLPFGDATRRRHRYTMVFDHDVPTPVQKLPEPPKTMLVRLPLIHEQASAVSLWR